MIRPAIVALLSVVTVTGCGSEDPAAGGQVGGPTFIENHPGELALTSPERAAFIEDTGDGLVTVSGTGATSTLTIDDVSVAPSTDGSFTTTIKPTVGLNLVRVVDGEHAIDTPFVFGSFQSPEEGVAKAVALRVNALGFDNVDTSVVSLTLVAKRALDDVDILGALKGQTLSGSIPGGSWKFEVKSTHYGKTDLLLSPRAGGAKFNAAVADIEVDGKLTIKILFSKSSDVHLTVHRATVTGAIDVGLAGKALSASANSVKTSLEDFKYHSGNAGLPCCVDSILTGFLRPKVQDAAQDKVKDALSKKLAFALNQLSLPETIDLGGAGFPAKIDVATHFDGASFDAKGGKLTAAVLFHRAFAPTDPGSKAPGWLTVGKAPSPMPTEPPFGVSISIDSLNQALFAAWGQNGLARTIEGVPMAGTVKLSPALPPLVLPNDSGGLTASAGEVLVEAEVGGAPMRAAITIEDEVVPSIDGPSGAIVLTPSADAVISVTWLAGDGQSDAMRETIEGLIVAQLPSLLSPVKLPLPTLPLGEIASSFGGAVGSIGPGAELGIDADASRAHVYGDLAIVH